MRVHREATCIRVEAPAKLNLFFEVLERRGDGFHEIETLMVPINLYDSLTFTAQFTAASGQSSGVIAAHEAQDRPPAVESVAVDCRWSGSTKAQTVLGTLPPVAENLATRAALLLRNRAAVSAGATIRLIKRIPSAAGLGGASSDAAATLVAGNLAWKINWPLARLAELAAELGSDVPFFLTPGAAICRGRGERLEKLDGPTSFHAVVVRPPAGLSTAQVYARSTVNPAPRSVAPAVAALARGDLAALGRALYNRLEKPAGELSAWIGRLKQEFSRLGCVAAQMTGSGSSYFGICHHAAHARHVAGRLRSRDVGQVYAVHG